MKKIQAGNFVVFNQIKQKESIKTGKKYEIIKADNFKRKDKYVSYITIKDEFEKDYRFRFDDSIDLLPKKKHNLEKEYEILRNIETYFYYKNEFEKKFLHKNLNDFHKISETSKNSAFKSLVDKINSKQHFEEEILKIVAKLLEIVEEKAYKIGLKIGNYKFENYSKDFSLKENEDNVDNFDHEKDVMNSFRNGEQDRYGY